MSTTFPINPNAGRNDGNPDDELMPEAVQDAAHSEDTPAGTDDGVAVPKDASAKDLPFSWSKLDETEAEQS